MSSFPLLATPHKSPQGRYANKPTQTLPTPQFSGKLAAQLLSPASIQQLGVDTGNVLVPKLPFMRSKAQLFEEVFLEVVEDAAFYFTITSVAMPLADKVLAKKFGVEAEKIGQSLGKKALQAPAKLIAAKSAALIAALSVASGIEFMVQHAKNAITAQKFHIKNFTAVAGLEEGRTELKNGETDPVEKAKRRAIQTSLATAGGLGAAALAPQVILKNNTALKMARHLIQYIDFAPGKLPFGLSRSLLALVIGVGVASYLDASRDSLERKESITRLAFVVPGLLFGKALSSDLVAWVTERFTKVGSGVDRKTIREYLDGTGISLTTGNPLKQAKQPESFLNFNVVEDGDALFSKLKHSDIPDTIQHAIIKKFSSIDFPWSYLVSAGIFGSGVCWGAFKQTQKRFEQQQEANTTPPRVNPNNPALAASSTPGAVPQHLPAGEQQGNPVTTSPTPNAKTPTQPSSGNGKPDPRKTSFSYTS